MCIHFAGIDWARVVNPPRPLPPSQVRNGGFGCVSLMGYSGNIVNKAGEIETSLTPENFMCALWGRRWFIFTLNGFETFPRHVHLRYELFVLNGYFICTMLLTWFNKKCIAEGRVLILWLLILLSRSTCNQSDKNFGWLNRLLIKIKLAEFFKGL